MSQPWDVAVHGAEWLRLLAGAVLFLLPGLAAADRILPGQPRWLLLAPVLSFTLLPLGAILLSGVAGVAITPGSTAAIAVAWTAIFGARRIHATLVERLA